MSLRKIVLVGAPGTGKDKLALALSAAPTNEKYHVVTTTDFPWVSGEYALGQLTDYRVELSLALWRANEMSTNEPTIFSGSLLDNLAHSCVYSADAIAISEQEALVTMLTGSLLYAIVRDTFNADLIFFLDASSQEPVESFEQELDKLYPEIFSEFGLEFVTLAGSTEEQTKQALNAMEAWIDANTQSDGSGTGDILDASAPSITE